MKINIFSRGKLSFNPFTEKNVGVGSTETTIVNVAEKLSENKHDVTVYCNCNFPDIYNGVRYYQSYDYKLSGEDALICFGAMPKYTDAKSVFVWSTKIDELSSINNFNYSLYEIKNLIVSSEWHRDRFASELQGNLLQKMKVIELGVSKEFLEFNKDKWPLSITYAGPPQKGGMEAMIEFAKRIKPKNKDILIYVYGGGHLWGWDNEQYRKLYDDLIRNRIFYQGQKGKRRLVKQLGSSQIFLYPTRKSYHSAFGLGILEAMASKCVVVANNSGNIKNLVKDSGYIIDENIEDYKWAIEAMDIVLKLFEDKELMLEKQEKAREYAKDFTWGRTVDKFLELI